MQTSAIILCLFNPIDLRINESIRKVAIGIAAIITEKLNCIEPFVEKLFRKEATIDWKTFWFTPGMKSLLFIKIERFAALTECAIRLNVAIVPISPESLQGLFWKLRNKKTKYIKIKLINLNLILNIFKLYLLSSITISKR